MLEGMELMNIVTPQVVLFVAFNKKSFLGKRTKEPHF